MIQKLTYSSPETKRLLTLYPQNLKEITAVCEYNQQKDDDDYRLVMELSRVFDGIIDIENYHLTYNTKRKLSKVHKRFNRGESLDDFINNLDEFHSLKRAYEDCYNAASVVSDISTKYRDVHYALATVKELLKRPYQATIDVQDNNQAQSIPVNVIKKIHKIKVQGNSEVINIEVDHVIRLPRIFAPLLRLNNLLKAL